MKKKTIKFIGISMIAVILVTGCGKVPKLENGQDSVVTLKDSSISVDSLYKEMNNLLMKQAGNNYQTFIKIIFSICGCPSP